MHKQILSEKINNNLINGKVIKYMGKHRPLTIISDCRLHIEKTARRQTKHTHSNIDIEHDFEMDGLFNKNDFDKPHLFC